MEFPVARQWLHALAVAQLCVRAAGSRAFSYAWSLPVHVTKMAITPFDSP